MSNAAKPDTWMPLVIGDYLKDTTRLTTEQHGAYLLLIMSYWVDGPPVDDDSDLAAITGLDAKSWRKHREKLLRFFRVEFGHWRHKRIDAELERWAAKKVLYAERAAAGGRAKAAKSTPQAGFKQAKTGEKVCLKAAPQPASREEEGPNRPSSLSGQNEFSGPKEVRDAFLAKMDDHWVCTWIDPCGWQDVPERALIPPRPYTAKKIRGEAAAVLLSLGIVVLDRAA
jgi:uncharacterized protein YdaU (DUF1376 family)